MTTATRSLSLGHGVKPPTCDPVLLFGPSKYSPGEQAADPSAAMTRVVKDVVSVGTYNIGGPDSPTLMDFDHAMVQAIADSVADQQARGHSVNLGYSNGAWHADGASLIPADQLIGPIDAARVHNGTLWVSAYVTPQDAARLNNAAMKVSQGVAWHYYDGDGNYYPVALVHVAVTDRPVSGGQGPFIRMANVPTSKPRFRRPAFLERLDTARAIAAETGQPVWRVLRELPSQTSNPQPPTESVAMFANDPEYQSIPQEMTRPEYETLVSAVDSLLSLFGIEAFPVEFKRTMDVNRISQHLTHAREEVAAALGMESSPSGDPGGQLTSAMMANVKGGSLSDEAIARRVAAKFPGMTLAEARKLVPR